MTATAQDLRMVADVLMSDRYFLDKFKDSKSAINRRRTIHEYGKQEGYSTVVDKIADRESIRQYIEDVEGLTSPQSDNPATYTVSQLRGAGPQSHFSPKSVTSVTITSNVITANNTMNAITKTQAIEVTTQVNVNGVNAANYSDAQLYGMIQQQEGEIKALNALQNKPQSLLAEIAKRQSGIDALVGYLNDRDAAKNPAPVAPAPATVGQATDQLAR